MGSNTCVIHLLLSLGWWTSYSFAHREYFLIKDKKIQSDAQVYCREHYVDLAVIGSHDDAERLKKATDVTEEEIWISLKKSGEMRWQWSIGETLGSSGQLTYTNWASAQPQFSHYCGGMKADGTWASADCGAAYPYVCQTRSGEPHFVADAVNWRQAQTVCRQNHSDLASARSISENLSLQAIINANLGSMVWLGLFKDMWTWSDQVSHSSFRYWADDQPNNDGNCTLYRSSESAWYDRSCDNTHYFYCYSDSVTRTRTQRVRVEIKSDTLDLGANDPAVMQKILKHIQDSTPEGKIKWIVQPDGNVFHKKSKTKKGSNSEL